MLEGGIVEYDAELGYGFLKTACGSRLSSRRAIQDAQPVDVVAPWYGGP